MKLLPIALFSAIALVSFSCSSCRSKKDATTTNSVTVSGTPSDVMSQPAPTGTGDTPNPQLADTTTKMNENNYGFVVSFYSPGNGIDAATKDAYDKFLEGYKDKVEVEQYRWGREGEIDYCLKLSKLSAAEKKDFIAKSRALLEKSQKVNISENAACVHKK
jgi:hypothetical protein